MTFQQRTMRYERLQTDNNNETQDAQEEIELNRSIEAEDEDSADNEQATAADDYYFASGKRLSTHAHQQQSATYGANNAHFPASRRFMQMAIVILALIFLYLTLSICLTFYQKYLLKQMKFPLSIVTYHMLIKFILAGCVRAFIRWHKGKARVLLDWRNTLRKMVPTSIAGGIDIGFSTWGMELVNISLYTMTKSTTIIFIMFFAILLGLEKKTWSLVLIVGLISSGLFMFTYKSTNFDMLGFCFLLIASMSSGIRWSLAQTLIQKSQLGLHNPIDMIYHMQPWMFFTLLPMSLIFEGEKLLDVLVNLPHVHKSAITLVLVEISFGAVLAFCMEVSEFLVLSKTSSLTLSIVGIFKEICQLALAVVLNGDQLSLMNAIGMVVCLAGICSHLAHKYTTLMRMNALQTLSHDETLFNETSINVTDDAVGSTAVTNSGLSGMVSSAALIKKHSAQTVPLLDEISDSYDSEELEDERNASDVIFDVLKRRDIQH